MFNLTELKDSGEIGKPWGPGMSIAPEIILDVGGGR